MDDLTLSCAQVRSADRIAAETFRMPTILLMENAARNAADALRSLGVEGEVFVCCGTGFNGGDGFALARHLDRSGVRVTLGRTCDADELTGDALTNFRIAEAAGLPVVDLRQERELSRIDALTSADWLVDALLGTGTKGSPRAPFDAIIRRINASRARVLAIDLPSGLDADAGLCGEPTVRADATVTFFAKKRGFASVEAQGVLGKLFVVDIGEPAALRRAFTTAK